MVISLAEAVPNGEKDELKDVTNYKIRRCISAAIEKVLM
jgi:hypothetical protein